MDKLLIQPLPYFQPERLVGITGVYPRAGYALFREQSQTMDVAQVSPGLEFNLTGNGDAVRLFGAPASPNLFSVLGVSVQRGRTFEPGEDKPGRDGEVILSDSLWKTKFGSDPQIIGRVVTLDSVDRTIIGVMPAGFAYPSSKVEFWIPARLDPSVLNSYWGGEYRSMVGRLRPEATLAQARSEVPNLAGRMREMFPFPMPHNFDSDATAIPLQDSMVGGVRSKLFLLLASVVIVLLIACANVASLLLSRATSRRKEMALRAALGAGRLRILRQLLTESVLLSAIGGGIGILLGMAALSVFKAVLPREMPGVTGASIDLRVLGAVTGLAVLTGLIFGIAPALSASRFDLADSLKTGSQRSANKMARLRTCFIGAELALTVVLVIAAGLLVKTLYVLSHVNRGFQGENILTIRISPNQSMCNNPAPCIARYTDLVRRAKEITGVADAAIANTVPLDGRFGIAELPVDVEGHPKTPDFPSPMFLAAAISPDYLSIMQVPLLEGRKLDEADGESSAKVILIDASTAKRFWPEGSAIGKHIKD
ncbi:MAG TPA: ABC transporter permease, partial [Blastocatellia bacterium]|nr:ABC transporter permease [Blastocatellia bacterium]